GRMDRVLARSRSYGASLQEMGIDPQKIGLVQAAIDANRFCAQSPIASFRRSYGVEQPLRLLYVGRVSVEKNLPMLMEILRRLYSVRRDMALIVVGDGPYRQQMQQESRSLPVHFLGMRSDKELVQLYQHADLLLFPSRTDTLGQVVMEAQACGLPALVSDEGGPREIVDDELS